MTKIKKMKSRYTAVDMVKIKTRKTSSIRNDSKETVDVAKNVGMWQKTAVQMRETRAKDHNSIRKEPVT